MQNGNFIVLTNIFFTEASVLVSNHRQQKNHHGNAVMKQHLKKSAYDPAPTPHDVKKAPPTRLPKSMEDIQNAISNFLLQSNADEVTAGPKTSAVGVTLQPFEIPQMEKNSWGKKGHTDGKRSTGSITLKKQFPRGTESPDPLPLAVLENLISAIQKNNHRNISDVINDLRSKLDIVYSKKVKGADATRTINASTAKPKKVKPTSIVQEMDKIMDQFLRTGPGTPSSESSSEDQEELDQSLGTIPVMRGAARVENDEDNLEFDIERDISGLKIKW